MTQPSPDAITTRIHQQHLQVRLNGRTLFSLISPLDNSGQLTLETVAGEHLILMRQSGHNVTRLFVTQDETLAGKVMDATSDALSEMAIGPRKTACWQWLIPGVMLGFLVAAWGIIYPEPVITAVPQAVSPAVSPASPVRPQPLSAAVALQPPAAAQPAAVATPRQMLSPEDAAEARRMLATRLKNGAAKEEFTVRLSSGHPRTLYMFIDPECPNCRIFEPTVQALSEQYNVEIFPVTLIGKARTAEQVVPLLCAATGSRAKMWSTLLDTGAGMLNPSAKTAAQPAACEAGQSALARNDMAFELYRLPGTPTVISDDGRMIPLQAMTSDAALQAFLNAAQ